MYRGPMGSCSPELREWSPCTVPARSSFCKCVAPASVLELPYQAPHTGRLRPDTDSLPVQEAGHLKARCQEGCSLLEALRHHPSLPLLVSGGHCKPEHSLAFRCIPAISACLHISFFPVSLLSFSVSYEDSLVGFRASLIQYALLLSLT